MKYQVLGPRVLLKIEKAGETYKDSVIVRPETLADIDTATQTEGEVVQISPEAYLKTESQKPWVKVGDTVHFSRYGAVRLKTKDTDQFEYWVINDKDILVIEDKENVE